MNDHRAASAPGKALGARRSLASHSGNGRLASPTAGTGVLGFGLSLSSGWPRPGGSIPAAGYAMPHAAPQSRLNTTDASQPVTRAIMAVTTP
jgi:hypothetical protein